MNIKPLRTMALTWLAVAPLSATAQQFELLGGTVNGVEVLCSNVMTANATVHIIGEVLMP